MSRWIGLRFDYVNHRGEDHEYIVMPRELSRPDAWWCIEADVIERDGEPRPGRRTFRIAGMRDVGDVLVEYESPDHWVK